MIDKFPFAGEIAKSSGAFNGQDKRRILCAAVDNPARLC